MYSSQSESISSHLFSLRRSTSIGVGLAATSSPSAAPFRKPYLEDASVKKKPSGS